MTVPRSHISLGQEVISPCPCLPGPYLRRTGWWRTSLLFGLLQCGQSTQNFFNPFFISQKDLARIIIAGYFFQDSLRNTKNRCTVIGNNSKGNRKTHYFPLYLQALIQKNILNQILGDLSNIMCRILDVSVSVYRFFCSRL